MAQSTRQLSLLQILPLVPYIEKQEHESPLGELEEGILKVSGEDDFLSIHGRHPLVHDGSPRFLRLSPALRSSII